MDRDTFLDTHTGTLTPGSSLFARYISPRDLPRFDALSERNQERIRILFQAIESIDRAPTIKLGCEMASTQLKGQRGYSAKRLYEIHRQWKKAPDWRILIDQSLENKPCAALPADFIEHLNTEVDLNGRSRAAVIKGLRRDWTLGKHIPGYGTWREWWQRTHPGRPIPRIAPAHPASWSSRTLYRHIDTSKARRKAATQGRIAAKSHRPVVLSSRVGCYVGSHYMFDDVWHDLFVNSFAEKQAGRPLEIFSHDYYSGRKVRWGVKVRTEGDNGKMQGLTGKMMRMVIAATFYLDGYSPRGTVNVAEHGTAAFAEAIAGLLYDESGGLITLSESGMQGAAAHAGQYDGRGLGNPNFKASLESSNNAMHNLEAGLPGQTGPDRQRRPEQLHGLLTYNARLLAAREALPPEKAALLQFPILEITQYMSVLSEIYQWMESDPEHDLTDWIECHHTTQEIHLLGQWHSQEQLMLLPEEERQLALTLLHRGNLPTRPRKMTRREVWDRGSPDLIRITGGTVCRILGDDFARERTVRSHQFIFEDADVGPGEHRYEAIITDAEGRRQQLKEGEIYKAFVNPFADRQLFVQDARGRFLGTALRCERASRADVEKIKRLMGHAAAVEQEILSPLAIRQTREAKKKLAMHTNNRAVIASVAAAREEHTRKATAALTATLPPIPAEAQLDDTHTTHETDLRTLW